MIFPKVLEDPTGVEGVIWLVNASPPILYSLLNRCEILYNASWLLICRCVILSGHENPIIFYKLWWI